MGGRGASSSFSKGGTLKPIDAEMAEKRKIIAEYFKGLGAEVDSEGMVTLYHATAKENVPKILENGFKPTDAPINGSVTETVGERVFFGHDKQWISDTWASNGSYEIMKVKIPAEYLHQAGKNTREVFVEGTIKKSGRAWLPNTKPTSTAWDRLLVKRWKAKNANEK